MSVSTNMGASWRKPLRSLTEIGREEGLRARFGNILHLLTGNFAATMLSLAAVALTARTLGPADYGTLALTLAYIQAVERLISFQSWQPLIRYGAGLMGPEDAPDLRQLLKFGLLLDVIGAGAAWLSAVAGAVIATHLFGWSERTLIVVVIYASVLLFNLNGTATAVLRLTGRFKIAAYGQVIGGILRLMLCAVAAYLGSNLVVFAGIWAATQAVGAIALLVTALRVLKPLGLQDFWRARLAGVRTRFPGIWNFALTANLSLTVRSSAQQFDTLLVGALADPASAGFYHIAKRIGRMAQQVGQQVQAVVYPEITRLAASGAFIKLKRIVTQVEILLFAFGCGCFLILLLVAEPLLRILAGPAFVAAAPLLIVQMVAVALSISGTAGRSAMLALGKQKQVLNVVLAGTAAFHLTAVLLIPRIGAMGANIAHIVLGFIWLVGLTVGMRRALRQAEAIAT